MASQYQRMPFAALPSSNSGAQAPLLFDIVSVRNWMRHRFSIYATFAGCVQMDRCILRDGVAFDFIVISRGELRLRKGQTHLCRV